MANGKTEDLYYFLKNLNSEERLNKAIRNFYDAIYLRKPRNYLESLIKK